MSELLPDRVVEPVEHLEDGWSGNRAELPFVTDRVLLTRVDRGFDLTEDFVRQPPEDQKEPIPADTCADLWEKAEEQSDDADPLTLIGAIPVYRYRKPWFVQDWKGEDRALMSAWEYTDGQTWYLNGLWLWLLRRWLNPDELRPTAVSPSTEPDEEIIGPCTAVAAYRDGQMVAMLQSMTPNRKAVEDIEPIEEEPS